MIEAGVVINLQGDPIHWHLPPGRTMGSIPDSRDLWGVFWSNRDNLQGFAHTHPGRGLPSPSAEDLTTFKAVELGLGRRLDWWILNEDHILLLQSSDGVFWPSFHPPDKLLWVPELRRLSYQ